MSLATKANVRVLFALTLVHFTGDLYSSFINPLFPLFVDKLGLTLTQVGVIAGVSRFLAFIVQPSVGYLADRYPTRHFVMAGLLLPVLCIPLSGVAAGFTALILLTAAGSFGSSMFHPSVTGMVPVYAGRNTGFAMSVFNTGGTLAFGVGPLFVTWYATRFGLTALPYTMIFGLVVAAYLYLSLPMPEGEGLRHLGFFGSIRESIGPVWKSIALIWAVMVLRAFVGQSFMTFMPVHFVEKGYSVVAAGAIFALFTIAGTVSGLTAGHISDRIGYRPVFLFCHLLMTPVLVLFLRAEGFWVYVGSALSGGFVLATLPIGVAMAQSLAPRGRSMVASLMMGFAFGLGGVLSPVVGRLADLYSVHYVLTAMSFVPLLTV
ncbi:MAG: MFS transporter, partial [Desulfobacteraceae bacterium]|nr:MFS transporter [Desulfobacteraceae bacterium]